MHYIQVKPQRDSKMDNVSALDEAPDELSCLVAQGDSIFFFFKLPKRSTVHHTQILARECLLIRAVVGLWRPSYRQVDFHADAMWNGAAHCWGFPAEVKRTSGSLILHGEHHPSTISSIQQTLCAIYHLGVLISVWGGSSMCIFRLHNLREGI